MAFREALERAVGRLSNQKMEEESSAASDVSGPETPRASEASSAAVADSGVEPPDYDGKSGE